VGLAAILAWLLFGLIVGAIARLLVPGRQPLGCLGTILLGVAGSLLGGFIGELLSPGRQRFEPAGILGSIFGAVLVLLIVKLLARNRPWYRRW
jgi:uncharacterized membrane protein YeaQ/YmgE (transglycosylase-associated protein family)